MNAIFLQVDAAVKLADVLSAKTVVGLLMFVVVIFALAVAYGFRLLLKDRQAVIEGANASRQDFITSLKDLVQKQAENMGEMKEMMCTEGEIIERCTESLNRNNQLLEEILLKGRPIRKV